MLVHCTLGTRPWQCPKPAHRRPFVLLCAARCRRRLARRPRHLPSSSVYLAAPAPTLHPWRPLRFLLPSWHAQPSCTVANTIVIKLKSSMGTEATLPRRRTAPRLLRVSSRRSLCSRRGPPGPAPQLPHSSLRASSTPAISSVSGLWAETVHGASPAAGSAEHGSPGGGRSGCLCGKVKSSQVWSGLGWPGLAWPSLA